MQRLTIELQSVLGIGGKKFDFSGHIAQKIEAEHGAAPPNAMREHLDVFYRIRVAAGYLLDQGLQLNEFAGGTLEIALAQLCHPALDIQVLGRRIRRGASPLAHGAAVHSSCTRCPSCIGSKGFEITPI